MISMLSILVFKKSTKVIDIGLTLLSVLYIPFFLFHIYYLDGSKYIWLVFIIAFGTDTFAYLSGNLLGKRKLSPNISPNKTIEGSLGGIMRSEERRVGKERCKGVRNMQHEIKNSRTET